MDYRSSEDSILLEICGNLGGAGNCWIQSLDKKAKAKHGQEMMEKNTPILKIL